jgi:hypothetical protein
MGCAPSFPADRPPAGGDVAALQNQVHQLQHQLAAAHGGGGGAYAPPVVLQPLAQGPSSKAGGGFTDVLFFPDPAMPCNYGPQCRRPKCGYAHNVTSLSK